MVDSRGSLNKDLSHWGFADIPLISIHAKCIRMDRELVRDDRRIGFRRSGVLASRIVFDYGRSASEDLNMWQGSSLCCTGSHDVLSGQIIYSRVYKGEYNNLVVSLCSFGKQ